MAHFFIDISFPWGRLSDCIITEMPENEREKEIRESDIFADEIHDSDI